jgi:hypothetical protein
MNPGTSVSGFIVFATAAWRALRFTCGEIERNADIYDGDDLL